MTVSKGSKSARRSPANGAPEPTTKRLTLDGYIRVSDIAGRDVESDSYLTEKIQEDKIRDWIKLHDHDLGEIHKDVNISGGVLERPGLNQVLERIESGASDGLVVYNISRFSRSLRNTHLLLDRIRAAGGVFASHQEHIDLTTAMGRGMFNLIQVIAEIERERIGENWGEAKARAARRGVLPHAVPYGYKRKPDGRLLPDPETAPIVKEIFKRRAAGETIPRIRTWLESNGIPTPRAGRPDSWTTSRVSEILKRSDSYLGRIKVGDIIVPDTHPPLIDPATWGAAQGSTRSIGLGGPVTVLLRGLVRCAGCRYLMTNRPGMRGRDYICQHMAHGARCPVGATVPEESGQLAKGLHEYVAERTFERLPPITAEALADEGKLAERHAARMLAQEKLNEYAANHELLEALGPQAFAKGAQPLREARDEEERLYQEELRRADRRSDMPARQLADDWREMSVPEQHRVLAHLIQAVFVRRSQPRPHVVAEARRLRAEGLTYKEIGARLDADKDIAHHWVNKESADGAQHRGATADRIHIVWADEPPVDVPWKGRRNWVSKPFAFPEDDGDSIPRTADLSELAASAYQRYLRDRFPEVNWVARTP